MRLASLRIASPLALALSLPLVTGAQGDGCSAGSRSPAPDTTGTWDITYDDTLGVKVTIGGVVYEDQIGAQGGVIVIQHGDIPITFDLDCNRPDVLCPSEAWPQSVEIEQREMNYQHQMIVTLPHQTCQGQLVQPAPGSCGAGTNNPDCDRVCEGDVVTTETEHFGVIGESGDSFRLYLGAGIASNGINCALLGWSVADADLVTEGRGTEAWIANEMQAGLVTVAYAGGCLWVAQADMDPELEAAVLAASVEFTTGFTGSRR
jgi:hypothetical protein